MFRQRGPIHRVHVQMRGAHRPLVSLHLLRRSPFISPVDLNDVLSLEPARLFFSHMMYTVYYYIGGWSLILLVQAFLAALFCSGRSVTACVGVRGYSGSPTGYCLTFFPPPACNFTGF